MEIGKCNKEEIYTIYFVNSPAPTAILVAVYPQLLNYPGWLWKSPELCFKDLCDGPTIQVTNTGAGKIWEKGAMRDYFGLSSAAITKKKIKSGTKHLNGV